MTGALDGLRVVEIAGDITGAYCTKLLVDLGANVIKIEPPAGDPMRTWGPFPGGVADPERSGMFEYLNAGKCGVTLDLTRGTDLATARELVATADVLVEALPPGALGDYGLDADTLYDLNPRLAVVRISNFGQSGPLRDRAMTPLTMQAASGWICISNPDRPPVGAGARILEYVAGAYAALGALTALRIARQAPGRLVEADLSLLEAHLATLPYPMIAVQRKRTGPPAGPTAGPMLGVVRVADGWIGVNCLTGQHWLDVCDMVGLPEYGEYQFEIMRGAPRRAEFFAKAQSWLDEQTVAGLVELSQAFRIPAAPVCDGATAPTCPQYEKRGFFVDSAAEDSPFRRAGAPFRLSKTPVAPPRAAPRLRAPQVRVTPTVDASVGSVDPEITATAPFAGLKVLDFSTYWAGAYVTCYLGALGADIVKVESIQRLDGFRYSGTSAEDGVDWYESGALWQAANLNKRDLTLDLSSERGLELVRRLAAEADVVVENFSPRVIEQFGLDYESLALLKPDVIQLRMPGFGLAGPWRDYVGWALNIEQTSGMSAVTGYPDGPPRNLGGAADPNAGLHASVALLAALEHRQRTGEGQLIEVAQIEAGACVVAEPVIEYSMNGTVQQRQGNRQRGYAQGVYPANTDNTWVALTVRDDADWSQLAAAMGRPDLLDDPRFSSPHQREREHDAFDVVVADWTRTRTASEIVDALRSRDVPAELLLRPNQMYDVPQLDARGFYEEFEHPVTGRRRYPGWPFRITPGPTSHHRLPPPTLGQHNDEILRGLGVTEADLTGLREERVIGERALNL
ncbi:MULTISPECIES: CoA transferase [unclassified Mycobacterium]|uniref:CaiB/BaiF CoA transferase family protein n=1 Tax=unclassified Mycobacterium TaxID=2642494 RepID=UPI0029C7AED7|nr:MULTISPECIES: CoA transferase [unclassified Mycobacterium]